MLLVKKIQSELETSYATGEAQAMVRWLLEERLKLSWTEIRWVDEEAIPDKIHQQLKQDVEDLLNEKPLQYILGETRFAGLSFLVNEHVLIPRPETEELVRWVLDDSDENTPKTGLDIGTGSGCIAISLKKHRPLHQIIAVDVSAEALLTASQNAKQHEVQIEFRCCSFLDEANWPNLPGIDLLVSNPPYISELERSSMEKNVTEWEPSLALFVPEDDPLLFYRKIRDFALNRMPAEATLYLELNQQLSEATAALFGDGFYGVEIRNDLNGNQRMLKAIRRH